MSLRRAVVVKLGGSLAGSARLPALLDEVARAARAGTRVIVVPGGGPFADAVRAAQAALHFSDAVAHDLALLAMAQYGVLLAALAPMRCVTGADALAASQGPTSEAVPAPVIWLPDPQYDARELERSWRISSDSLALWLADRLGVRRVVLVKTCAAPVQRDHGAADLAAEDMAAMSAAGIVDAAYSGIAAGAPEVSTTLVFDADAEALRAALAANT